MRRAFTSFTWWPLALGLAGCGASAAGNGPTDSGPPGSVPIGDAPTGQRWTPVPGQDACGKTSIGWVLADEVCGAEWGPTYMDAFFAPMFRDGVQKDGWLFAVDASSLWVIDAPSPSEMSVQRVVSGVGQPLGAGLVGDVLVLAAGGEGVVFVDVSDPLEPVRLGSIPLDGPALDVWVAGTQAFVAAGPAGVAVIDVDPAGGVLAKLLDVPGFAAGVAVSNGTAYVAACDTFAIVDVASGALVGETWVADAFKGDFLVAPAKDVELSESGAVVVAAGRFGAVEIDVSTPAAPAIVGNCTIPGDTAFYTSGVRRSGDRLYLAAGEYGIHAAEPAPSGAVWCAAYVVPSLPEIPGGDEEPVCSTTPPWDEVAYTDVWTPPPPPPPGSDPIQVLPIAEGVLGFGDARRNGIRAVDAFTPEVKAAPKLGRMEEPRHFTQVAAQGDQLLVLGERGGLFVRDEAELLVRVDDSALYAGGLAGGFLSTGEPVFTTLDGVLVVGGAVWGPLPPDANAASLAVRGTEVFVPGNLELYGIDALATPAPPSILPLDDLAGFSFHVPATVASAGGQLVAAAPDELASRLLQPSTMAIQPLPPHEVFDAADVLDAQLWRTALPRRLFADTPLGLAEVATLGPKAGVRVHAGQSFLVPLPPGTYVAAASEDKALFVLSMDRARYRSQLVRIDLAAKAIVGVTTITGAASGLALSGDRLYVANASAGLEVFARAGTELTPLGTLTPEPLQ